MINNITIINNTAGASANQIAVTVPSNSGPNHHPNVSNNNMTQIVPRTFLNILNIL